MSHLELNSIIYVRNPIEHYLNKVYDVSKLHLTLKSYENMLNNKLGHRTKASIDCIKLIKTTI